MIGWQCPGCTRCYAPSVSQCMWCGPTLLPTVITTKPWTARCTCGDPPTTAGVVCPVHGAPAGPGTTTSEGT